MKLLTQGAALAALALAAISASATSISITLDQPTQAGNPGATIQYFGTITNNTGQTIYLNADSLDETDGTTSLTFNDLFFTTVPLSLAPGTNSGDIELFDAVPSVSGVFTGSYTLLGGSDGNAQDNLGSVNFAATPEPSSLMLLASGSAAAAAFLRRRVVR